MHSALTEAFRVHSELTRQKKILSDGRAEKKRLFNQLVAGSAHSQSMARNEVSFLLRTFGQGTRVQSRSRPDT